jgi:hypothetical protein
MKLKIAGVYGRILSDDKDDLLYLRRRFRDFITHSGKKDFDIKIVKAIPLLGLTSRECREIKFVNTLRTEMIKKADKLCIVYKRSKGLKVLGCLDPEKRVAQLFRPGGRIPKRLFDEFIRRSFHVFLEHQGGFLLHASGAVLDDQGYVFTGPAGCGKSTAVRLLTGSTMLSDECIAVKRVNGSYRIFGTPFHGNRNIAVEPKAFFLPCRAGAMRFKKVGGAGLLKVMLSNIFFAVLDEASTRRVLTTLSGLMGEIPCYRMYFSLSSKVSEGIKGV